MQTVLARQQHDGLDVAAEIRPLRRTHAAVDREQQPNRRAEEFEIARVLPIAAGAILAPHADRLIERGADLVAARLVRLFQIARVDVVFGALAARQHFRPCTHQRLELFEFFARQRMHAPGLQVAARRRARRALENVADDCLGDRGGQEGPAGISGGYGVAHVHGENSAGIAESVAGGSFAAKRLASLLPRQNPRHLLQAAPAEIGGEHD